MSAPQPKLFAAEPRTFVGPIYSMDEVLDKAVAGYRQRGFPYRTLSVAECMWEINKLAQTEERALLQTNVGYKTADTFHHHRMEGHAAGRPSTLDAFNDDVKLRKHLRLSLENGNPPVVHQSNLGLINGTQATSNFRPGYACYIYRRYAPADAVVLDTSTGYGGRLVGAIASGRVAKYIGIDPSVQTHEANLRMAAALRWTERVELYNLPAEDLLPSAVEGRCDLAFTSPPYFAKEVYADDDTQSYFAYRTAEEWRTGFLLPMMELQFAALKPACHTIVNIADVNVVGRRVPLVRWTRECAAQAGFLFAEELKFSYSGGRFGAGLEDRVQSEPCLVFIKP